MGRRLQKGLIVGWGLIFFCMCGMSDRGKEASLRRLSGRGRDVDVGVQNNGAMLMRREEEEGMGRAKEEEEEK